MSARSVEGRAPIPEDGRRQGGKEPELFTTTVAGIGPYCVEFPDGEIIHTRTEERQRLIAAAPRMFDRIATLAAAGDAEAIAIVEAVNGRA